MQRFQKLLWGIGKAKLQPLHWKRLNMGSRTGTVNFLTEKGFLFLKNGKFGLVRSFAPCSQLLAPLENSAKLTDLMSHS